MAYKGKSMHPYAQSEAEKNTATAKAVKRGKIPGGFALYSRNCIQIFIKVLLESQSHHLAPILVMGQLYETMALISTVIYKISSQTT